MLSVDLSTLARFKEECQAAIRKEGSTMLDVLRVVGIGDDDAMFAHEDDTKSSV